MEGVQSATSAKRKVAPFDADNNLTMADQDHDRNAKRARIGCSFPDPTVNGQVDPETAKKDPPAGNEDKQIVKPGPSSSAGCQGKSGASSLSMDTSSGALVPDPDGFVARALDTVDATPRNRALENDKGKTSNNNKIMGGNYRSHSDNTLTSAKPSTFPELTAADPPAVQQQEIRKSRPSPSSPRRPADRQIVESMFSNERLAGRLSEMNMEVDYFTEPSTASHKRTSQRLSSNNVASHSEASSTKRENSDILSTLMNLPELVSGATLDPLTHDELKELEAVLEITADDGWREDWSGNLALVDKEIPNPKRYTRNSGSTAPSGSFRQALYTWAQKNNTAALKCLHNLFRYVYHLEGTPPMAKAILANADLNDCDAMEEAFRRVSYDPVVLKQDGWTTAKTPEPTGATGGAHRIGEKVRWQGADGIVIAYIHDHDLGDLWRGVWFGEGMESFDMEAEELVDARRKLERRVSKVNSSNSHSKQGKKKFDQTQQRRSHRFNSSSELRINGVEYGIVLAASFSRGARPGVYWPARVMNASEACAIPGSRSKRCAPRQRLDLVFLAPYWNSRAAPVAPAGTGSRRLVESFSESLARHGESLFNSGPLFDVESVDVSDDMIKEYPYDCRDGGVNVDQLRVAFRFSGLPKAAFQRFLDSHRLALALKTFAQEQLPPRSLDSASAGLFETHPMSVMAPIFPSEIIHLPYAYILSQLPAPPCEQIVHDGDKRNREPILRLHTIIEAMNPPSCWGQDNPRSRSGSQPPAKKSACVRVAESPFIDTGALLQKSSKAGAKPAEIDSFTKDLMALKTAIVEGTNPELQAMYRNLLCLVASMTKELATLSKLEKEVKARSIARSWIFAKMLNHSAVHVSISSKTNGEDAIGARRHPNFGALVSEWRRACERVYKYVTQAFSGTGYGNGVSYILTDFRCNQHVTSCGCFERSVRLPAALKAAKDVGAGTSDSVQLATSVEKAYVDIAENKVLMKAHSASYLRRMKSRCSQIQGDQVVYLTEDSDGNGGEDTILTCAYRWSEGSRGTWMAAVTSVGAAIKAVDMVVEGQCVNAFCATRPPGHHAGRDLHPMKAVSNGFCILNTAACAALHATTPLSEGGPGLRRVCVIDFDVHHGNGTQDILCSTYDPRFLYVSLHAGGAHVNGLPPCDDFDSEIHSPGGNSGKKGIYPGRCGDSSPHQGVLNIPLGPRVTPHAVGTALINQVSPAVEAFSPDLIILSAGFDAHKNDPLGLGGLSADDFGHITDVACQLAFRCCSGRVLSLLEGGYGVPCCRPQKNLFLPQANKSQGQLVEKAKLEREWKEKVRADESIQQRHEPINHPEQRNATMVESDHQRRMGQKVLIKVGSAAINVGKHENSQEVKVEQNDTEHVKGGGLEEEHDVTETKETAAQQHKSMVSERPQPSKLLDVGDNLPPDMDDQVPYALQRRLEKCHVEGFVECVKGHVKSLIRCNTRS